MSRPYATQTIMRTQTVSKNKKGSTSIFYPAMLIIFVLIVVGGLSTSIYLKNKTEILNKESLELNAKVESKKREIKILTVKQAEFKEMAHILLKIRDFNLALRPALPYQRRAINPNDLGKPFKARNNRVAYNR